mgnify:CR=1 FL=1
MMPNKVLHGTAKSVAPIAALAAGELGRYAHNASVLDHSNTNKLNRNRLKRSINETN